MKTVLFDKILGGLLGMAIGDAMGGPVEGLPYSEILARHGVVSGFLKYSNTPGVHVQWKNEPGTITDDTRLGMLLCDCAIRLGHMPTARDLAGRFLEYYYRTSEEFGRAWIEEYALKGVYGEHKMVFGGQPTNGAIMMIAPVGLIDACRPDAAARHAFELSFATEGLARDSAAMAAAAVAEACRPGSTVHSVVSAVLAAPPAYRRDGALFQASEFYGRVGRPNEDLVERALAVAGGAPDVLSVREKLQSELIRDFANDGPETLAVSIGMFVAAQGDFEQSVIGAVNYGRDCDSYASVAGAIAGALNGASSIPDEWARIVQNANPEIEFCPVAEQIEAMILARYHKDRRYVQEIGDMTEPQGTCPVGQS
ncbi:MAG TPA: hypothetical protein DDZ84_11450 [Firmicutes bacterium]|nr:hypothetical protein [Bacillota bacterium]